MAEMIKLSDYIFRRLADHGVRHVFLLTGGGAMHLNDSLRKETRIEYICNHHEQACAMAAEGYARVSGQIGVVCVTTGPGGTNALTGVLGQWLDSIPALYISGQVRYETTVASTGLALRQLGDQEGNIVDIVKPITKYAVTVTDPQSIRYHMEKALYRAQSGRPGPVWLEIPLNVQGALVDPENLPAYDPAEDRVEFNQQQLGAEVAHILERIKAAQRPVILAGAGIRLAGAVQNFHGLIEKLQIPVLTAWNAIDLMPSDHPLFYGRPSTLGQRGANFIFQNADLLLSIGCRLNVRQIGYNFAGVARAAYKISVDIDPLELRKPTLKIDFPVHCDARLFLEVMNAHTATANVAPKSAWLSWCKIRADRYPVVLPAYWETAHRVNPYVFVEVLSRYLKPGDVMVSSNGAACVIPIQALRLREEQRHLVNSGCAAMGYGLPAAIGACFAHDKRPVICFEGDGSLQLNIQEMQTIVHHQLPLKIFVFNNGGYLSIRTTQEAFFAGNYIGEGPASGVSFPDLVKIGTAYGIHSVRIQEHGELDESIPKILETPGPVLCDVLMPPDQSFAPRASSQRLADGRMISKPLEDLAPFLDRDEFLSNMIIPPWDEGNS
jgi:acetolactate synthase-1/2/3 large subunit